MKSLLVTCCLFFGMIAVYIILALAKTDNIYTYMIDDAYIHMSIAKNFALHNVWGMTEHQFSSTSSSPLFTYLLSVFISVFGNYSLIPLVFNLFMAVFTIYFLNSYYAKAFGAVKYVVVATLFTLLYAVMHLQVLVGMEHVFQVLMFVINIYFFQRFFQNGFKDIKASVGFLGSLMLLGIIRFEAMFYFASLSFLFLLIKNFRNGILVLIFGFLPILIFGYFNFQKSGHFFPNSVLVKGSAFDFNGNYWLQIKDFALKKTLLNTSFYKVALIPLLMSVFFVFKDFKNGKTFKEILIDNFLLITLCSTLMLHNWFGNFKGTFRYEAYLMIGFCMVIIPRLKDFFVEPLVAAKKNLLLSAFVFCNIVLLVYKFQNANLVILKGTEDVYTQHVQSAKFLHQYYNTSKVVANDIGAICYFTDIHLFDIAGLGTAEMIEFNENEKLFGDDFEVFLTNYCTKNNFDLAIVYEEWFNGHVPKNWQKVAVLNIDNKINARGNVAVFAINKGITNQLRENVKNFNWDKRVKVDIIK